VKCVGWELPVYRCLFPTGESGILRWVFLVGTIRGGEAGEGLIYCSLKLVQVQNCPERKKNWAKMEKNCITLSGCCRWCFPIFNSDVTGKWQTFKYFWKIFLFYENVSPKNIFKFLTVFELYYFCVIYIYLFNIVLLVLNRWQQISYDLVPSIKAHYFSCFLRRLKYFTKTESRISSKLLLSASIKLETNLLVYWFKVIE